MTQNNKNILENNTPLNDNYPSPYIAEQILHLQITPYKTLKTTTKKPD
ncbi:hypothetical protein GGR08_001292 [Bartonella fuyuanensis]|uniref:Uncharacterized protein n=1 Tax=Bartonella fuyuanensis TaxID=1460968 RepID=A0A840E1X2_9HYPH|nr:hypothetical protein [Bartonella fuyuanensis]